MFHTLTRGGAGDDASPVRRNESNPKVAGSFFMSSPNNARAVTKLLKATYARVHQLHVPVVAPAMAGIDSSFLKQLYRYGARGHYDVMSLHPYGDPKIVGKKLDKLHAIQRQNGDKAPMLATEYGWTTATPAAGGVSEAQQAVDIVRGVKMFASKPYMAGAYLYEVRDEGTDPSSHEGLFGVVHNDYSPKPGLQALTNAYHM
jgi:polysaccharide biosynthesis protein PslG